MKLDGDVLHQAHSEVNLVKVSLTRRDRATNASTALSQLANSCHLNQAHRQHVDLDGLTKISSYSPSNTLNYIGLDRQCDRS